MLKLRLISIFATTYIDEYVPIITPRINARLNPLINSPPKINKANKTSNVVKEVTIVLPRI